MGKPKTPPTESARIAALNLAIATYCGTDKLLRREWLRESRDTNGSIMPEGWYYFRVPIPNYATDLECMREAEERMAPQLRTDYVNALQNLCRSHFVMFSCIHATAVQKATAYVQVLENAKKGRCPRVRRSKRD